MVCLRYGEGDGVGVGVLKETVDTYPRTPADKSVDICLNREREREREAAWVGVGETAYFALTELALTGNFEYFVG